MKRDINVVGIDIAKRVFHVIGMDKRGTIIHALRPLGSLHPAFVPDRR
jgi:hypothetical protein